MTAYAPSSFPRLLSTRIPHDRNPAANTVRDRLREIRDLQQRSVFLGSASVKDDLARVAQEASVPGWDGYGASPINPCSRDLAVELILSLPLGFPRPSPGVEPDGSVTLEWYASPRRAVSVSVSGDGYLHYAALFGTESHGGMVEFDGELPERLVELIREVHPA